MMGYELSGHPHRMPYKLHQAQAPPEFLREKGGRSERRETYLDMGFVSQHFVDVVEMLPDHRFDTEDGQGRRVAQALLRRIGKADRFMFGDEQIRICRLQRAWSDWVPDRAVVMKKVTV